MHVASLEIVAVKVPALDAYRPGVSVWHDSRAREVGYSATAQAWRWLRIVGVGTYRFPVGETPPSHFQAAVVPEEGVSAATLEDYFLRSVLPIALQSYGFEVLHGGAVQGPSGRAVVLCGPPGSGKSTLAYALATRAARQLTDDAAVVDGGSLRIAPLPFTARLRSRSAAHFGAREKERVRASWGAWSGEVVATVPLAAVVVLERVAGLGVPVHRRLEPATAFRRLLEQAYAFSLADEHRKRTMTSGYLRMARTIPVFELRYPDGLENLERTVTAIEVLALSA